MALLLKMYQQMKLIREKNLTELALTQATSKKDRVTKNIEKINKRYTSLFANIDAQAKQMQSQAKLMFQNMYGLGSGYINNYLDPSSFSGLNGFVTNMMGQILAKGIQYKKNDKGDMGTVTIGAEKYAQMLQEYMQKGGFEPEYEKDDAGNPTRTVKKVDGKTQFAGPWSEEEVNAFNYAMQNAKYQQQQAQMDCSNMSQQYDTNVSVWQEAAKAQLEAEQDAAIEPLTYQETMWDLEKNQLEVKLKRIESDLDAYKQSVDKEAQDASPKFGV